MIAMRWLQPLGLGVLVVVLFALAGCQSAGPPAWGASVSQSERAAVLKALPVEASRSLVPLSEIFYERITSRRFNSRATFEDPSMRQFFPTVAAYSDYYAALVDALELANIQFSRPTEIELLSIRVDPSGSLRLSLRFVGENDLPLRWWNAILLRTDEWLWENGRWWVVPGKV